MKAVLSAADASGYRVIYAGHSMGGAVGVLAAASDERIKLLISLAGMVNTQAFYEREFGEVTPDSGCMWEEASCPLSSPLLRTILESIGITTAPKASRSKSSLVVSSWKYRRCRTNRRFSGNIRPRQ